MTPETKRTTNQYATEYGFFVGLIWTALFFCYAEGISNNNTGLVCVCIVPALISLIAPPFFCLKMNFKLYAIRERFSYGRGFLFSMYMFFFASVLSAATTHAYIEFFNEGRLMESLAKMMSEPEVSAAYRQMGMGQQHAELMQAVGNITAWDMSISMFCNGIMLGLIASIILAYVASVDLNRVKEYEEWKSKRKNKS